MRESNAQKRETWSQKHDFAYDLIAKMPEMDVKFINTNLISSFLN